MNEETKGLPVVSRVFESPSLISDLSPKFGTASHCRVVHEADYLTVVAERDALQAELAAMREQKPALWIKGDHLDIANEPVTGGKRVVGATTQISDYDTPLYAAPVSAPVSAPSQVAAEVVQVNDDMLYRGVMALNENCAAAVDGLSVDLRKSCEREALAVYLAMHRASDIGPVFTAFCNYIDALNVQSAPPVNRLIDALDEYFHADSALLATSQEKA